MNANTPKYSINQPVWYTGQEQHCIVGTHRIKNDTVVYDIHNADPPRELLAIGVPEWAIEPSKLIIAYNYAMVGI